MKRITASALSFAAISFLFTPHCSHALDNFEFHVMDDEIAPNLRTSMELQLSNIVSGSTEASVDGGIVPNGTTCFAIEPAFGLTDHWDVGAVLPIAVDSDRNAYLGGFRLRSKWIAPHEEGGFFFGVNGELGKNFSLFEQEGWGFEVRPIFGAESGRWRVVLNTGLHFDLVPQVDPVPEFEPSLQVTASTSFGVGFGAEYFASLGKIFSPNNLGDQEHLLFAVAQVNNLPFELSFGLGHGLTAATHSWVAKTTVGKSL